jgi:hypothetical protein
VLYEKVIVFWDIVPCSLYLFRRFGGTSSPYSELEIWGIKNLPATGGYSEYGHISQKMAIFIITSVETSNLTRFT